MCWELFWATLKVVILKQQVEMEYLTLIMRVCVVVLVWSSWWGVWRILQKIQFLSQKSFS